MKKGLKIATAIATALVLNLTAACSTTDSADNAVSFGNNSSKSNSVTSSASGGSNSSNGNSVTSSTSSGSNSSNGNSVTSSISGGSSSSNGNSVTSSASGGSNSSNGNSVTSSTSGGSNSSNGNSVTSSASGSSPIRNNNITVSKAGATIKAVTPMAVPKDAIDVTKNGVVANRSSAASSNTTAINSIIRKATSGATIYFPKGEYYISNSQVSHITISGKSNLTILGQDALIINTSYEPKKSDQSSYYFAGNIFHIINSSNINISGLSFDYEKHVNICGTITKVSSNETTFKAYTEYINCDYPVQGEEPLYCVNIFNKNNDPVSERYLDNKVKLKVIDAKEGLFSIPVAIGSVGQQVCCRFGSEVAPMFSVDSVKGMRIHNIWVRSSPSATMIATGANANFTFEWFKVGPVEGSKDLFSSNSDCMHIKGLKGELKLSNCSFEGLGDDALNMHSMAGVISNISGKTVTITYGSSGEALTNWANAGDSVDVYGSNMKFLGSAKVVKVTSNRIELDNLPSGTGVKSMLHNVSRVPTVTIDNCIVKRGRARGFLIQAPKATITNCTFEQLGLAGILVAPDVTYWYEMGPCESATIKNNSFTKCCLHTNSNVYGVITVALTHNPESVAFSAKPHGSITVTNNKIIDSHCNAVYVHGAKSILVTDNQFGSYKVTTK